MKAYLNGTILDERDARISIHDRGFLYGDSVFETLRAYGSGKTLFAADAHVTRLFDSAACLGITLPHSMDELHEALRATVAANMPSDADFRVRVMVTRGSGGDVAGTSCGTPTTAITVTPVAIDDHIYEKGIAAACVAWCNPLPQAKTGNFLMSILATREAEQRGAAAAILCDGDTVTEGATANIFIVKNGALITPPADAALRGITRAHVMALARARNIPVEERAVSIDDCQGADECFLTSSVRELVPVVSIDGKTLGSGVPGPVTRMLHRDYRAAVSTGK